VGGFFQTSLEGSQKPSSFKCMEIVIYNPFQCKDVGTIIQLKCCHFTKKMNSQQQFFLHEYVSDDLQAFFMQ